MTGAALKYSTVMCFGGFLLGKATAQGNSITVAILGFILGVYTGVMLMVWIIRAPREPK